MILDYDMIKWQIFWTFYSLLFECMIVLGTYQSPSLFRQHSRKKWWPSSMRWSQIHIISLFMENLKNNYCNIYCICNKLFVSNYILNRPSLQYIPFIVFIMNNEMRFIWWSFGVNKIFSLVLFMHVINELFVKNDWH